MVFACNELATQLTTLLLHCRFASLARGFLETCNGPEVIKHHHRFDDGTIGGARPSDALKCGTLDSIATYFSFSLQIVKHIGHILPGFSTVHVKL